MTANIQKALREIDDLLVSAKAAKKAPAKKKKKVAKKKAPVKKKAPAKKKKKKTSASAVSASSRLNLRILQRLIRRGFISSDVVVAAIEEAMVLKRMNRRLAEIIAENLRDTLSVDAPADHIGTQAS